MYAIIETGGKQYRVEPGSVIYIEKLDAQADEEVIFDKVIAVKNTTLKVGKPYVKDAVVKGTVVKNSVLLQGTELGERCKMNSIITDKNVKISNEKSWIFRCV